MSEALAEGLALLAERCLAAAEADAAAAALRRAFACGFRDVARARGSADLADVLARPEIESLLR